MSAENVIEDAHEYLQRCLAQVDEERNRLESALAALDEKATHRAPGGPPRRSSTAGTPKAPPAAPRKRRKPRGGSRGDQAVELIAKNPGIGAGGIAKEMKIKPNYLYRVLGDLEKEKRVKKKGRRYFPAS